ncbi:MAG: Hsp20/alpha crystallin family protein [Bacteroidia bacterium]
METRNTSGKDFVRDLGDTFNDIGQKIGSKFNQLMDEINTEDGQSGEVRVAVDVYETTTDLIIEAELPGLTKKAVSLKATGNVLSISGEKHVSEVKNRLNRVTERRFGAFTRLVTLPEDGLKMEEISAKFTDGVLTVSIPKLKPTKPETPDNEDLTTIDIE